MKKVHYGLMGIVLCAVMALCGCGGGGGGAVTPGSTAGTSQPGATGVVTGYVYAPIGSTRTSGRVVEPLRILASAPSGFEPVTGATVTCTGTSGSAVTDGNGMYTLNNVEPGTQKITVTATGKKIMEQDVSVNPGTTSVAEAVYVTPETTNSGSINVTSIPSGARIYLDNTDSSFETPHVFENVITGSHIVYMTKDGYIVPTPVVVTVTAGATALADFNLATDNTSQGTGLMLMNREEYETIPVASPPPTSDGALPSKIDLSDKIPPVKSQGGQGSCTAWATAYYLKGYQEKVERNWDSTSTSRQFSPAYVFNQAKEPGGCAVGTYIIKALDLIQNQGVATWDAFPYDPQSATSCTRQPDESVKRLAADYKIKNWKRVSIETDEIKGFLNAGQPVVIAMRVYQNFFSLERGQVHKSNDGTPFTGKYHAILVVGYDNAKNAFKIVNSWDTWWGDSGYGWIDYTWFNQIVLEAYVTEDVEASVCGNGKVESGEQCDDGNKVTETCAYGQNYFTVCNASCQSVQGATSYCGDGKVNSSEQCDDGNTNNNDNCLNNCRINSPAPICGNGTVEQGEQCDDGNTMTETCQYGQTSCAVCTTICKSVAGTTAYCGDGKTNGSEQCDDGNSNNNDSCTNRCRNNNPGPVCGNGTVETGEICDDGNTSPVGQNDHCGTNCRYIRWYSAPYVNQYSCTQDFGSWHPGYSGYSIANASCAESSVTMLSSLYPTGMDRYDCSTVNAVINGYLAHTGKTMNAFINDGTVGRSLCEWVNGSSLNVSCQYYEYAGSNAVTQLKQLLKTGPVVLGLNPYRNSSGQTKSTLGHYILVRGYNEDDGLFVVNDPAGNADQNWGGNYNGELMGYNVSAMLNGVTGKFLVIRAK